MNTVLVGLVAGAFVLGLLGLIFGGEERKLMAAWLALLGLSLGLVGGFITAGAIGSGLPKQPVVLERHQLVSLHDATGIEGHFFLASGQFDSQTKIYYVESTAKGYQFHSMLEEDSHVYVVQEDRTDGELDVVTYRFQNPSDGTWAIPFGGADYIFHIPTGSLVTCYQLQGGGGNTSNICSGK